VTPSVPPIFDAHFHIVDAAFPLVPNDGYVPDPFSVEDYRRATTGLGVMGGAVVSGSFQAFDQAYLEAALARLGPGFVGVTQLPPSVSNAEIGALDSIGVRAVRFNLVRGGSASVASLARLGRRVHEVAGWHVEVYADGRHLPALAPHLRGLPLVGLDHMGLSGAGLDHVLDHLDGGGFVKASGFGRTADDLDVAGALARMVAVNPAGVVFGSDLPSTRAPRPFARSDVELVTACLGEDAAARVLGVNAVAIYRP